MNKSRLEAFSDGVLAIIITIMVLEMKVPHGTDWATLWPLLPVFLSYVLSFILIGIYWGNHHHLLHSVKQVSASMILANLHLLFWLSLLPVATGWMGENQFAPNTVVLYAIISLLCAVGYSILHRLVLSNSSSESSLHQALQKQTPKMLMAMGACLLAAPMAYVHPLISGILFLIQSLIWFVPDKNVEEALVNEVPGET